jgi:hypothetical protein
MSTLGGIGGDISIRDTSGHPSWYGLCSVGCNGTATLCYHYVKLWGLWHIATMTMDCNGTIGCGGLP